MDYEDFNDYFDGTSLRADKVEDLLVEVCSGRYIFRLPGDELVMYGSRHPTMQEQDSARIIYATRLHEAIQRGLKPKSKLEEYALSIGIINPADVEEKKSLSHMVERYKDTRDRTPSHQQRLELDVEINTIRKRMVELESATAVVLQHSAEAHAEDARINFYVACCTVGGRLLDKRVWATFEDFEEETDALLIRHARRAYARVSHGLPTKIIRALARSYEWRLRWQSVSQTGAAPFDGTPSDWDKNKLNIVYWSKFYDNIYQHPDCPKDSVVEDDDALQDWVNDQVAKRNANKPAGVSNRPSPTYIQNGVRKQMTPVGPRKSVQVNQPYRLRTGLGS